MAKYKKAYAAYLDAVSAKAGVIPKSERLIFEVVENDVAGAHLRVPCGATHCMVKNDIDGMQLDEYLTAPLTTISSRSASEPSCAITSPAA